VHHAENRFFPALCEVQTFVAKRLFALAMTCYVSKHFYQICTKYSAWFNICGILNTFVAGSVG